MACFDKVALWTNNAVAYAVEKQRVA